MPLANRSWTTFHPSVYRHAAEPVCSVTGELRPRGAIRYCCPVTGSFVLVTDPALTAGFAERPIRLHCPDCDEMHLVTQAPARQPAAIVAAEAKL